MSPTRIEVAAAPGRARCTLVDGALGARLVRAGPAGARVATVARGALLLGGDEVEVDVVVRAGAWLEVVETAGTVAYPGPPARWTVRAHVEAGGALAWEGLPFVVADGADVTRTLRLDLADGARALVRDVTVLGRAGESGGAVRLRTDVTLAGGELLVEDLDLGPVARAVPGVLGANRVLDVVAAFGFRPPDAGPAPHRMDLAGPGAVVRYLGPQSHASSVAGVYAAWADALSLPFRVWTETSATRVASFGETRRP